MRNDGTVTPEVLESSHARLSAVRESLGLLRTNVTQMAYLTRIAVEKQRAEQQRRDEFAEAVAVVDGERDRVAAAQDAARRAHDVHMTVQTEPSIPAETQQSVVANANIPTQPQEVEPFDPAVDALIQARAAVDNAAQVMGVDESILDMNADAMQTERPATVGGDAMGRLAAELDANQAMPSEVAHA